MGMIHGTGMKLSNASPLPPPEQPFLSCSRKNLQTMTSYSVAQHQEKKKKKLSCMWYVLALGNSKTSHHLSKLGVEGVETYHPLAALVGSDSQWYWRLEDVERLVGKDIFPEEYGLYGEDVLKIKDAISSYELSCRLLSTKEVHETLLAHRETVAYLFEKALTFGQCTITYQKGRKYNIKPGQQTVIVMKLAEMRIPSSMAKFAAEVIFSRCEKKPSSSNFRRFKRLSSSYTTVPDRKRIYLSRSCKEDNSPGSFALNHFIDEKDNEKGPDLLTLSERISTGSLCSLVCDDEEGEEEPAAESVNVPAKRILQRVRKTSRSPDEGTDDEVQTSCSLDGDGLEEVQTKYPTNKSLEVPGIKTEEMND